MTTWALYKTQTLIADGTLEIGDGYRAKNSEMGASGIPFIRAGDVNGRVNSIGTDLLSFESVEKVGRKRSKAGDIVITTKGTIGRMAIVLEDDPEFIYSPQLCYWRSLDVEKIHPRWLFYALQSNEMKEQMSWSSGQTDMAPYISLTDQRTAFKITLPKIKEQREIAAILGALDDKIELNRKTAATLEEMARALYRSWFVDFDPVHARSQGLPPAHMDHPTAALFPDSFGDDGLPEGWTRQSLRDISKVISKGTTPRKNELAGIDQSAQVNFLKVNAMTDGREIKRNSIDRIPSSIHLGSLKRSILHFGDVLFSIAGTIGRTSIVEAELLPCNCNQAVAFIRPQDWVPSAFMWAALNTPEVKGGMLEGVVHAVQANLSLKQIGDTEITLPPPDRLEKMFSSISTLIELSTQKDRENQTLATLRDTLLPRLMSGELRVGDARDQIKEAL